MKNLIFLLFVPIVFLTSCKKQNMDKVYEIMFEVDPSIHYMGPKPPASADHPKDIPGMLVKNVESGDKFILEMGRITGFIFNEGYAYVIEVEVTELAEPPIDGHLKNYKLIKIISKDVYKNQNLKL